jgi:hypothetical protein
MYNTTQIYGSVKNATLIVLIHVISKPRSFVIQPTIRPVLQVLSVQQVGLYNTITGGIITYISSNILFALSCQAIKTYTQKPASVCSFFTKATLEVMSY